VLLSLLGNLEAVPVQLPRGPFMAPDPFHVTMGLLALLPSALLRGFVGGPGVRGSCGLYVAGELVLPLLSKYPLSHGRRDEFRLIDGAHSSVLILRTAHAQQKYTCPRVCL
jgi:hypothetical protein